MFECHDRILHSGIRSTMEMIKIFAWWPNLELSVMKHCRACAFCKYGKPRVEKGVLTPRIPPKVGVEIGIDFLGPIQILEHELVLILIIVDLATGYTEAVKMNSRNGKEVTETIDRYVKFFKLEGKIKKVLCDNAPEFIAGELKKYCDRNEIKIVSTAIWTPRQNGQVERKNAEVRKGIKAVMNEEEYEGEQGLLNIVTFRLNNRDVGGTNAISMFTGEDLRMVEDQVEAIGPTVKVSYGMCFGNESESILWVRNLPAKGRLIEDVVKKYQDKVWVRRKRDCDRKNKTERRKETDMTGRRVKWKKPSDMNKDAEGPYTVVEQIGNVCYVDKHDGRKLRKVCVDHLVEWYDGVEVMSERKPKQVMLKGELVIMAEWFQEEQLIKLHVTIVDSYSRTGGFVKLLKQKSRGVYERQKDDRLKDIRMYVKTDQLKYTIELHTSLDVASAHRVHHMYFVCVNVWYNMFS